MKWSAENLPNQSAIAELLNKGTIQQLFVYFSGHGVNNRHSGILAALESSTDPQEAVNVSGSVDLARRAGVSRRGLYFRRLPHRRSGIEAQSGNRQRNLPDNQ